MPKVAAVTPMSGPSWTAIATADLAKISPNAFVDVMEKIDDRAREMREAGLLPDIAIKTGVMKITPQIAERMLLRNTGNRRPRLNQVQEIAILMQKGYWRLAQPLLFDENSDLLDGQHRLFAIYFGGHTIETTVMVVPVQENTFSVIDSGRRRNGADTLYTAGVTGGVEASTAGAIGLLYRYDRHELGSVKQPHLPKISNLELLFYNQAHPEVADAAREVASDFPLATKVIDDRGVAAAFAYLVNQNFDDGVLHDFYMALGRAEDTYEPRRSPDDPIEAVYKRLVESDLSKKDKLSNPRKLGLLIKAFQLDAAGMKVGRNGVFLRDNEKFPSIEETPSKDETVAA